MQKNHNQEPKIVIGFAGDTMLGRLVNETISQKGYAYPWGDMHSHLKSTDLNIINLETTLTKSIKKTPKVFNFKADPDKVKTLQEARIDIVNLANNHILDFSEEGLFETIKTLNQAGILHTGAGENAQEARKAVIIEKNNIKIGVIGYTDNEPGWKALENKSGINYISVGDIEKIKQDILNVRDQVDILILSIHWGPNMRERPTQALINFAHQIIDSGVDIIHGHSAHIFQAIEIYKNKLIMYDTGDFVNDYRVDPILRNDRSFLYRVTAKKSGIERIGLIPTIISYMQVNQAQGKDHTETLARMKQLSAEFGILVSDEGTIIIQ